MTQIKWRATEVSTLDKVFDNIFSTTPPAITILLGVDSDFKKRLEKDLIAKFQGRNLAVAYASLEQKNISPLTPPISVGRPVLLVLDSSLSAYRQNRLHIIEKLREVAPDRRIIGILATPEHPGNSTASYEITNYPPDPEEFDLLITAVEYYEYEDGENNIED